MCRNQHVKRVFGCDRRRSLFAQKRILLLFRIGETIQTSSEVGNGLFGISSEVLCIANFLYPNKNKDRGFSTEL